MKKVILIFTLAVIYFAAVSTVSAKATITEKSKVTVVSVSEDPSAGKIIEDDKDKKKDTKKVASDEPGCAAKEVKTEKPSTGCSEAQMKSCAASQKSCCGEKKPVEKK